MSLLDHFHALDAFLVEHSLLWRPRPFVERELAWEAAHPELAHWLRNRSLEQAEAAQADPASLDAPAPFPGLAAQARQLGSLDPLPSGTFEPTEPRLSVDVPGRKWQQIEAFSARLQFTRAPSHWLDWCAGKGHLGRRLARHGQALTCLEWDPALVESGARLSERLGIMAEHRQQDVLADSAQQHLEAHMTPVALHACGDLHVRLLELAISQGCTQLALAPCCYNRTQGPGYRPLSQAAQASALTLDLEDLRLPIRETVTAGARVRRQRDQSMAWRLGFDLLQRQLRGEDRYLPTPSLPADWLHKSFADYCRDLAALKGLPGPGPQDWTGLESAGWQRLAQVRNLELVRALFRRPLELWLTLDRALLLEEHGYNVRLGTFCDPQLTPRNLLLLAERN